MLNKKLCLFFIFAYGQLDLAGCNTFQVSNRIVGGQTVDIKNYPYQVSIAHEGQHACGGSILTVKFILSAAHCFDGPEAKGKTITVRAGSSFISTGGQIVKVKAVTVHGNFNADTYDYDIAVAELASALKFGTGIAAIERPPSNNKLLNGQMSTATGWGFTSNDGDLSNQLQMVTLPIITTKQCQKYYPNAVTVRMVCAGNANGGKDSCTGDSGGPLVFNGVQVGIVSWGDICAGKSSPGVYTKVSKFVSFIEKIIK